MSDDYSYRQQTYLILCGSFHVINGLAEIVDGIHLNGSGGHSFSVILQQDGKNVLEAGGFDGDGADRVSLQAVGFSLSETYSPAKLEDFVNKIETFGVLSDTGKGDTLLIIKGTRCGVEAIREIVKNILNLLKVSGQTCTVISDDKPCIILGSLSDPSSRIFPDPEDGFGFMFLTGQEGDYCNPFKFFENNGYEPTFFRGRITNTCS